MASALPVLDDFELIERYTDQPARLPAELGSLLLRATGEAPIRYALVDLDERLQLSERWLALTPSCIVALAPGEPPLIYRRASVRGCATDRGLSCNTLRIELEGETAPLLARFTQRQRSAVERVVAALEGDTLEEHRGDDRAQADRSYAAEVVRPLRNAQALVSRSGLFIIARLLRYLLPYRRQLGLGLGAAALITLCMLVPPYLTGYLIDRVLRPAQAGALSTESAARLGWLCVGAMAAVYVLRRAAA